MKWSRLVIYLLVISFLFSCRKKSEGFSEAMLLGRWQLTSIVSKDTEGTSVNSDKQDFGPEDYFEFKSPDILTVNVEEEISQTTWRLMDENKRLLINNAGSIALPAQGLEIKSFSASNLELYSKSVNGQATHELTFFLLKK